MPSPVVRTVRPQTFIIVYNTPAQASIAHIAAATRLPLGVLKHILPTGNATSSP
jgi:hypothetical protein